MADTETSPTQAPGPRASTAEADTPHKLQYEPLVSASRRSAIEWYDWTIFAAFLVFISPNILPTF